MQRIWWLNSTLCAKVHLMTFDLYNYQTPRWPDCKQVKNAQETLGYQKIIVPKIPPGGGGLLPAQSLTFSIHINRSSRFYLCCSRNLKYAIPLNRAYPQLDHHQSVLSNVIQKHSILLQPFIFFKFCNVPTVTVRASDSVSWQTLCALQIICIVTARCTLVQSAVLRSHVVCLSVRPSVRPSVCL